MAPYVGEIRIFAGNFAPLGWEFCNGQEVAIAENEVLFQLIGTTYGGDGETTFNLPNLQSRLPVHMGTLQGTTFVLGEMAGVESVTLTTQQIPSHTHPLQASSNNASSANASGNVLSTTPTYTPYFAGSASSALASNSIAPTGGSQPHDNIQPFLCVNFIISMSGIFPQQT